MFVQPFAFCNPNALIRRLRAGGQQVYNIVGNCIASDHRRSRLLAPLRTVEAGQSGTNLDGQKRHEVRNGQHTLSSSAQGTYGAESNPGGRAVAKRKNSRLGVFSYGAVLSGGVPLCQSVTSKAGIVDDSLNGLCGSK